MTVNTDIILKIDLIIVVDSEYFYFKDSLA